MGILFSRMLAAFGEREARILVLGLDNAGKTTILYRLQVRRGRGHCHPPTHSLTHCPGVVSAGTACMVNSIDESNFADLDRFDSSYSVRKLLSLET